MSVLTNLPRQPSTHPLVVDRRRIRDLAVLAAAEEVEERFGDMSDTEMISIGQIRALLNCQQLRRWAGAVKEK